MNFIIPKLSGEIAGLAKAYHMVDRLGEAPVYGRLLPVPDAGKLRASPFRQQPGIGREFCGILSHVQGTKMTQPLLPQEIEQESFRRIEAAVGEHGLPAPQWAVVRRMIHASAEVELLSLVRFHPQAIAAGVAALRQGRPVFTDTRMLLAGISSRLRRQGIAAECLFDEPGMAALARAWGLTRSAAAVELARQNCRAASWPSANAPTSLRRLLALLDQGMAPPALIIGMPVGFVDAAESKEALLAISSPVYNAGRGPKAVRPWLPAP